MIKTVNVRIRGKVTYKDLGVGDFFQMHRGKDNCVLLKTEKGPIFISGAFQVGYSQTAVIPDTEVFPARVIEPMIVEVI